MAKVPGFSAEAALYERVEHYEVAGIPGSQAGAPAVVPQQQFCLPCFKPIPFLPGIRVCLTANVGTC